MARRTDVTPKAVADLYLDGISILDLSVHFDCAETMIQARLKTARERYPDLPWASRKPRRGLGPTSQWTTMNDGVPGQRAPAKGSIVNARRR